MSQTTLQQVEAYANNPVYRQNDWDGLGSASVSKETFELAKKVAKALDSAGIEVDFVYPEHSEIVCEIGLSEIRIWGCEMPQETAT